MKTEHKDQEEQLRAMQTVGELSFLSADYAKRGSTFLRSGWWVHQNLSKVQHQQVVSGCGLLFSFISMYIHNGIKSGDGRAFLL
jgi:hypothetical protein